MVIFMTSGCVIEVGHLCRSIAFNVGVIGGSCVRLRRTWTMLQSIIDIE